MTITEPNVSPRGHYNMKQTADILGIHRNSLRSYNKNGLIKSGNRKIGRKDKFFLGSEIIRFWKMYM